MKLQKKPWNGPKLTRAYVAYCVSSLPKRQRRASTRRYNDAVKQLTNGIAASRLAKSIAGVEMQSRENDAYGNW